MERRAPRARARPYSSRATPPSALVLTVLRAPLASSTTRQPLLIIIAHCSPGAPRPRQASGHSTASVETTVSAAASPPLAATTAARAA